MSRFEDHLWREVVREHGDSLARMSTPTAKRPAWRSPRLVAGTGFGLGGAGVVVALVLTATATSPAFAVTRNHDGTVTISVKDSSGIAGANARLHRLGIRAQVMLQTPSGLRCTPQPEHGAPAPGVSASQSAGTDTTRSIANDHWTIPPQAPVDQTLALTPPPQPPGANSANSASTASSAGSGSGGQVWSCGTEGPVSGSLEGHSGSPPPAPSGDNSGNSGVSTG